MTDLLLTAERREELAALLGDEHRLRNEFPKVAEYLDMAPRLNGTGNDQADAAFDLRFVHYVTGGKTQSSNPYWDIVSPAVSKHNGRLIVDGGRTGGSARLAYAQMLLQAIYAYAIPSPETLEWIAHFCGDCPVLELGAGRGYWASLLTRSGLTVNAYDSEPPNQTENLSFRTEAGQIDVWHHVGDLGELATQTTDLSDHVLFLCWPPGWGDTMASEALAKFDKAGGNRMVFIGEPKGGKTGNDAFFDELSAKWELTTRDTRFVSWWNLSDVAQAWTKC